MTFSLPCLPLRVTLLRELPVNRLGQMVLRTIQQLDFSAFLKVISSLGLLNDNLVPKGRRLGQKVENYTGEGRRCSE